MLKRKIYDELLAWKKNKKNECLLVKGARQVGKSFIIEEFGRNNYQSMIVINFFKHPEYKNIFEGDLSPAEIYKRISLQLPDVRFEKGKTLLFLDEIQHCPAARTAIKFLATDEMCDVISSGSLLGLHYKEMVSVPVGYERQIEMYSLDFEEFLWAYGYGEEAIAALRGYFERAEKIPDAIHSKLSSILREYLAVGGMPDVVNTFFATHNFQAVNQKQSNILAEYEEDINKYASATEKQKIGACYYSLPRQLAKEYTKFQYSVVSKGGNAKKYEHALDWLTDAGFVKAVYNVSMPQLPLRAYEKTGEFKIYGTDIGLVTAMCGFETQAALVEDKLTGPAKGGIYENLIFDMLTKRGIELHYIKKESGTQEIEFLIEQNRGVIPVEVKSKRGSTQSLNAYLKEWDPPLAYKITAGNIGVADGKVTLPHYLAMFI